MYQDFLTNDNVPIKVRCQVLKNLQLYLLEEEITMAKSDAECELLLSLFLMIAWTKINSVTFGFVLFSVCVCVCNLVA